MGDGFPGGVAVGFGGGEGVRVGVFVGLSGGLLVVVGVTLGVEVAGRGALVPLLCKTSKYCPNPDDEAHSTADSTEVPSPHSLKVVTSCQGSPEATMELTLEFQVVRSRPRRTASPFFQNPGLIA